MGGASVVDVVEGGAVGRAGRLVGVDMARGLAVLGMFVVHVGLGWEGAEGRNVLYGVAAGRAAVLFAVLAGVSIALMSGGPRPKEGAEMGVALWRVVVRALLVLPLGVWLTLLDTGVAVILAYYAVFFVLAVPLLGERWPILAGWAVVLGVAGPVVSFFVRRVLEGPGGPPGWVAAVERVDPLEVYSGHGLVDLLVTGSYPALTWMPFVVAGMALGRLDLGSVRVRWALVGVGVSVAAVAYGAAAVAVSWGPVAGRLAGSRDPETGRPFGEQGVAQVLFEGFGGSAPSTSRVWLLTAAPHGGTPPEVFGAGGVAVALLGVFLLAGPYLRVVLYPLGAVGALALTVYVGHIVVIWAVDAGVLAGTPLAFVASRLALSVLVGALVGATVWRLAVGRGPLEWALHVVSSWVARRIP